MASIWQFSFWVILSISMAMLDEFFFPHLFGNFSSLSFNEKTCVAISNCCSWHESLEKGQQHAYFFLLLLFWNSKLLRVEAKVFTAPLVVFPKIFTRPLPRSKKTKNGRKPKKYGLPSDRAPHRSGSAILEQPGHVSQVNIMIMPPNMIFLIVEIFLGPMGLTVNLIP